MEYKDSLAKKEINLSKWKRGAYRQEMCIFTACCFSFIEECKQETKRAAKEQKRQQNTEKKIEEAYYTTY